MAVASTLSVARSNLYERPQDPPEKRGPYTLIEDCELLPMIIEIVDERPTYGYRRVCAVLNRKLREQNQQSVNHKRVYRLMRLHGLLLTRAPKKHETPAHSGKIITTESDQRWCGDGFEIACDNGEKLRVIFVLDCCDREVISFAASQGGYTAQMAQSVLISAVETRFNSSRTPHWLEWLTDNGSCFTARETLSLAREIGIINCFTPVRSPESNGMAEAFVKTIKRDYADLASLPDAKQALRQLSEWIEDYNENAPHKGLKMLSPREYRRQQALVPKKEISSGAARAEKAA